MAYPTITNDTYLRLYISRYNNSIENKAVKLENIIYSLKANTTETNNHIFVECIKQLSSRHPIKTSQIGPLEGTAGPQRIGLLEEYQNEFRTMVIIAMILNLDPDIFLNPKLFRYNHYININNKAKNPIKIEHLDLFTEEKLQIYNTFFLPIAREEINFLPSCI